MLFLSGDQTQVFSAVAKFMKLLEGQPFRVANLLLIVVTSHSSCVFLSILVFNCQLFASKVCLTVYRAEDAFENAKLVSL